MQKYTILCFQWPIFLFHAKFSIYLGASALKSYISSSLGTYLSTWKCSQELRKTKCVLPLVRSDVRIRAKSTTCNHNCG